MNKIIGCILVILYFASYHICNIIHPKDDLKFWDLRVSIYCLIFILALNYKRYIKGKLGLIESIFISIVINNIIVNYFFNEKTYSYSDLIVIPLIMTIEYAKHHKVNLREYLHSITRDWNISYFNNKKEK